MLLTLLPACPRAQPTHTSVAIADTMAAERLSPAPVSLDTSLWPASRPRASCDRGMTANLRTVGGGISAATR